jgi:hypothetical protein
MPARQVWLLAITVEIIGRGSGACEQDTRHRAGRHWLTIAAERTLNTHTAGRITYRRRRAARLDRSLTAGTRAIAVACNTGGAPVECVNGIHCTKRAWSKPTAGWVRGDQRDMRTEICLVTHPNLAPKVALPCST